MTSTPTTTTRSTRRRVTATLTTVAVIAGLWLLGAGTAAAATVDAGPHTAILAAMSNPLDGVKPDLGVFGPALNSTWKRIIAGIWGAAMAACVVWVILAGMQYRTASKRGMAGQVNEGRQGLQDAGIGLGVCAAAGVIVGGVLFLVGT